MNTSVEHRLLVALAQLEATVKSLATAKPKPSLLPLFAAIDELSRQLPAGTDPTLLHYLQKKSYLKAQHFLQGRAAESQAGNRRPV